MSTRRRQARQAAEQKPQSDPGEEESHSGEVLLFTKRRVITQLLIVVGTIIAARYFLTPSKETFVSVVEHVRHKAMDVPCSKDYSEELNKFKECTPKKCGRIVMDEVVTEEEAENLLRIAKNGLALGGGSGGASILDLHSGALSKGTKFINIYSILQDSTPVFTEQDFELYRNVRHKIQTAVATTFGVPEGVIYLTKPTFFSRMNTTAPKTVHDEYWHPHIDKETYGSFDYTSLLYLSNYGTDFGGGRFVFIDNVTSHMVEPKLGRLSFFTSGSENVHYVERVTEGTRYAITVSFTCDPAKAIRDPTT